MKLKKKKEVNSYKIILSYDLQKIIGIITNLTKITKIVTKYINNTNFSINSNYKFE